MNCQSCGDKGLIRLNWSDAPDDYAICLCPVGMRLRATDNAGHAVTPLWRVWCAMEGIDPDTVFPMEDVLTDEELRERGFARPGATARKSASIDAREAALLSAGKTRRAKL